MKPSTAFCSFLLFLASLSPALAQSTGRLSGIIRDPSGAAVPDAIVSLYRPGMTDPANQTKTTAEGLFQFDALAPESYRVTIEKSGFSAYEATEVRVSPGTETTLNGITLAVGGTGTSVKATEKLQGVQTSNAEVSTTLSTEQLDRLPILNRDPLQLITTQAGVVTATGAFTVIDAIRTSYSNVTLDGINVQDNSVRYNALDFLNNNLKLGQVSQFTLVTSNQAAIYGNGATQIAFASPSGTNELHGSVFFLNSNNPMNANNWFLNQYGEKDAYKSNQGGFTVGGPIIHNKLFGYADLEMFRQRNSIGHKVFTLDVSTLESLAAVPVNPVIAGVLARLPQPNVAGSLTASGLGGQYAFQSRDRTDHDNATGRLDYVPSSRHTITAAYLWNRINVDTNDSLYSPKASATQRVRAGLFSVAWRFNPTAHLTNEVRFGANNAPFAYENLNSTLPYSLYLGQFLEFYNPAPYIGPSAGLTAASNKQTSFAPPLPNQGRTLHTYDVQDNASYVFGRHNLQFGFQSQIIRVSTYLDNGSTAFALLGDPTTTNLLTDVRAVLQGNVWGYLQNFNPVNSSGAFGGVPYINDLKLDNYAPYVQDNWKIGRRLALNLGLRYDYYTPVSDGRGEFYVPQLTNSSVVSTILPATVTVKEQGNSPYSADKKNFAPHIGVAFDPFGNGRTSLRAGYSISYVNDDVIAAVQQTYKGNIGFESVGSNTIFGPTTGIAVGSSAKPTIAVLPNLPSLSSPVSGTSFPLTTGPNGTFVPFLVDPNLRTPYVQQWNAGIQQELWGFLFDLRYVGNHATKMLRARELQPTNTGYYADLGPPSPGAADVFTGFYGPPDVFATGVLLSNSSSSSYNAVQFDVNRRLRSNLQFQANYTFAKALSDSGQVTSIFLEPYRNAQNFRLDRGPSLFDIRHAFKANFIYDLPFGRNASSAAVRALLGGWGVSSIITAQTGAPFSILYGDPGSGIGLDTATTTLTGGSLGNVINYHMTPSGPSIIADSATNLNQSDTVNYKTGVGGFPGQAFFVPLAGPGQLQPRMFHGPASFDWDLGIQRRFKITERQSVELRGVAVNVLNHPSFGFTDQVINFSGFGLSSFPLFPPRTIQLSLYYRF